VPTYEYACSSCDATHEVVQKMTDPTLTECPVCGKPTVRKLFSGVGIHFKGSGFYRTDSRDSKSSSTPAKDTSSDKSSGGSSDKSSSGSTEKSSSGSSEKSSSGSSEKSASKPSSAGSSASS
jgi:putative FmdB family regulatory protein